MEAPGVEALTRCIHVRNEPKQVHDCIINTGRHIQVLVWLCTVHCTCVCVCMASWCMASPNIQFNITLKWFWRALSLVWEPTLAVWSLKWPFEARACRFFLARLSTKRALSPFVGLPYPDHSPLKWHYGLLNALLCIINIHLNML